MKTLLLMRHAKSSWDDSQQADYDRPLNERGLATAPLMARRMRELGLLPQVIFYSTARRASETAQLVARALNLTSLLVPRKELYLAEPNEILATAAQAESALAQSGQVRLDPECVLVIGHNPGMEQLVGHFSDARAEALPTAALARVALELSQWSEVNPRTRGSLVGLWRPKEQGSDG